MAEEVQVEMTEDPKPQPVMDSGVVPAPVEPQGETPEAIKAELEKTRKALKDANREAAERRKKLEELEAVEQKRKEAEMTEGEKLSAKLKALEEETAAAKAELEKRRADDTKREVARRVGLPDVLALRIVGDTPEAMEEDAKAILAGLPKSIPAPKVSPTNPGGDASPRPTDDQLRAEIFGTTDRNRSFNPTAAAKHGGGVVEVSKRG